MNFLHAKQICLLSNAGVAERTYILSFGQSVCRYNAEPLQFVTGSSFCAHKHADGQSMWTSTQNGSPPPEPDYNSIEQLFCLPVTDPKAKKTANPVKKESKEVISAQNGSNFFSELPYQFVSTSLSRLHSLSQRKA